MSLSGIIKPSMVEFVFIKFHTFSIFFWRHLNECVWSMKIILWDVSYVRHSNNIRTTFTLQKTHCKNFWWNCDKNESSKCSLGNKQQKWMFVVVSRSDVHLHGDNKSNFNVLLRKDKPVKIYQKNLQVLATKIYKIKPGLSPQIINNVFELKSVPYNIRIIWEDSIRWYILWAITQIIWTIPGQRCGILYHKYQK